MAATGLPQCHGQLISINHQERHTMKLHRLVPTIVVLLFISGCATLTKDIEVRSETAPGINLADYKTFAWIASAEIVNDPHGNWEPPNFDADAEIKFLLLKELRDKGLEETMRNPDLLLLFAAGVDMENLELVKDRKTELHSLEEAPKGALLVIMVDPATRHPVWVGSATGEVESGRSNEDVRKRLAYAVKKMFADWAKPARTGGY